MNKYYVAKLNVSENIFSDNLQDIKLNKIPSLLLRFIGDGSNSPAFFKEKVGRGQQPVDYIWWTITDVSRIDEEVIQGNLTKVFQKPELEIEGTRTRKEFVRQVRTAHFYYLVSSEKVFFQSTTDISFHIFCKKFEQVLLEGDKNFEVGTVVVELLTQVLAFQDKIMNQPVFRVHLRFTAPNDPKTSGSIADILLNSGAKKGDFKAENFDDDKGLLKKNDNGKISPLFADFLELLSKGYGSLIAWVGDRKKPTKIQSSNFPVRMEINSRSSNEEIASQLKKGAKSIEKEQPKDE